MVLRSFFLFFPFSSAGNKASAKTINPGAYFKVEFAGPSIVLHTNTTGMCSWVGCSIFGQCRIAFFFIIASITTVEHCNHRWWSDGTHCCRDGRWRWRLRWRLADTPAWRKESDLARSLTSFFWGGLLLSLSPSLPLFLFLSLSIIYIIYLYAFSLSQGWARNSGPESTEGLWCNTCL